MQRLRCPVLFFCILYIGKKQRETKFMLLRESTYCISALGIFMSRSFYDHCSPTNILRDHKFLIDHPVGQCEFRTK